MQRQFLMSMLWCALDNCKYGRHPVAEPSWEQWRRASAASQDYFLVATVPVSARMMPDHTSLIQTIKTRNASLDCQHLFGGMFLPVDSRVISCAGCDVLRFLVILMVLLTMSTRATMCGHMWCSHATTCYNMWQTSYTEGPPENNCFEQYLWHLLERATPH